MYSFSVLILLQLEEMRQLTLHTAWSMDQFGNKVHFCLLNSKEVLNLTHAFRPLGT